MSLLIRQYAPQNHEVERWLEDNPPGPVDIDCIVTVKLKILDGKCKMPDQEKVVMSELYDAVRFRTGQHLDMNLRQLIREADRILERHGQLSEGLTLHIYELRLLAESRLARPVMKAFKKHIRDTGLLPKKVSGSTSKSEDDDE